VEEYNPATDTWARKADMPRGVWGLCASVASGKIYAMGGRQSTSAKPYVQEYDPATDTWTQKADMPIGTSQMGSVVLGNKIVVMGGWYWSAEQPYTTVQMYDLETDTWTIEADVPFQRAVFSADVLNNRIYAIGGTDKSHPCPALSTVYEFGPKPPDFNVDGIIDATDVCIMVDHWGDNYPLCDIAPLPFGDSIVDIQDLIVLSEYLFTDLRIFVDDDALNDPAPGEPLISDPLEDGSSDHPFDSIQEAIDAASFGPGCVVILPGTYTGEGNYDITFEGKAITVRSIDPNDSAIVASTVIDCQGTQDVRRKGFIFNKGESAQSVLDGLTITNAHAGYIGGGGINCTVSSPTISRCVLRNNKATQRGGGMYIASGSPVVSNCIFSGNTAADGGALYNIGNALVLNCTFTRNLATSGGKIHNLGGTLTLNNCILWDYTTPEIRVSGGTVSVTYSDIRGGFTGEGNINVDPLFADPANGDYHLKSHAGCWDPLSENWVIDDVTSPCIDAGDPSSPLADEPEPNGGRINMGAYGGTTEASKSP
jgi:parallel beta-helix repeat protein